MHQTDRKILTQRGFYSVDCTSHMIDLASKVLHEAQHAWENFNYDTNFAYILEETDNQRIFQEYKQNSAHYVNNKSN